MYFSRTSDKGGYLLVSATGSVPVPKYCCHCSTGFVSPKRISGIEPSINARWPSTQSGWQPPFNVGNVVGASLISSMALNTAPFERVKANWIMSFVCIFLLPFLCYILFAPVHAAFLLQALSGLIFALAAL